MFAGLSTLIGHMELADTKADQRDKIQYQALLDLSARARGGIFIYPAVWLITTIWADMPSKDTKVFIATSALLFSISLLRIVHNLLLPKYARTHAREMYPALVGLIMLIGLVWGLLSSWVIFHESYPQLKYPYIVIIAAVGIGGTSVLSISRIIGIYYPFLIFVPTIACSFYFSDTENYILSVLAIFSMAYVIDASKSTRRDYQTAIKNRLDADEKSRQLKRMSIVDELTGLHNRKYFTEHIVIQWKECSQAKRPIAILMYDLDYFKKINDGYGHLAGDKCLALVGSMLGKVSLRDSDIVARYGGEEFIIILPNATLDQASALAKRLVKNAENLNFEYNNERVPITCSIGVACALPDPADKPERLIAKADQALYQAKTAGRNRFCVADA